MKRVISILLVLVMALLPVGCQKKEEPAPAPVEENFAVANDPSNSSGYPVTILDQAGRHVTIEEQPQRVISGSGSVTSILMAMGQQDKLVAIEPDANENEFYETAAPKLLRLPGIGWGEIDINKCLSLKPDLVILPADMEGSVQTLEDAGVQVLLVTPDSRLLLQEMADMFGAVLGCKDAADTLVRYMDRVIDDLDDAVAESEMPTVYMAGEKSVLSTAGPRVYSGHLVNYAGGINVADEIKNFYWTKVSYEQVVEWNPAYIIISSKADYTVEDVLADPELAEVDAVKNGNVYQVPSNVECWDQLTPGSVLGALWLGSVLHPDLITEQTVNETAAEFYQTLYNYNMAQ